MTTHTLRLIDEYLTQGGHAPNIDADTLDREAALVAAAPDLLAALKSACFAIESAIMLQGLSELSPYADIARKAITKATGA